MGFLFLSEWINIGQNQNLDGITKIDPQMIGQIFKSIYDLIMNLTYILIVLINSIENILIVSLTTFIVKYIESIFNISLSLSLSNILTGSIIIPAAIFGTITGGYLICRFHMNIYQSIKLILICCFISLIFLFSLIFLKLRHELQSFSLGFENCNVKLLSQIPTPILFGIILDDQCLF
ncbi:unnamed protein product [Rotaria sp. Silwood2]|nr:unnamed protein product [Rotaria sp. Silwood2]